jgi:hypothetical protein
MPSNPRLPINRLIDAACGIDEKEASGIARRQASPEECRQAKALADEVIGHIDAMYPAMWQNVPKTARISVRNTVYNRAVEMLARRK